MKRSEINYIIDALMAISFFLAAITGLVIFFFLPNGVQRGGYQEFLGIIKHVWVDIHNWSGIILILLVVVHLILHWDWVVSMTKNICSKKEKK